MCSPRRASGSFLAGLDLNLAHQELRPSVGDGSVMILRLAVLAIQMMVHTGSFAALVRSCDWLNWTASCRAKAARCSFLIYYWRPWSEQQMYSLRRSVDSSCRLTRRTSRRRFSEILQDRKRPQDNCEALGCDVRGSSTSSDRQQRIASGIL